MRHILLKGLGVILALVIVVAVVTVLLGRDQMLATAFGPVELSRIDWSTLSRSQRPNQYLVCPPGFCAAKPDAESPVYPVAAATLRDRWLGLIDQQSGIERVAVSPDHLQYDIIQRSRLLHFPDSITVRFIPLGEARSTLAIYSRAHYGYSDFGVNRQRVQSWLSALQSPSPGSYQTR